MADRIEQAQKRVEAERLQMSRIQERLDKEDLTLKARARITRDLIQKTSRYAAALRQLANAMDKENAA